MSIPPDDGLFGGRRGVLPDEESVVTRDGNNARKQEIRAHAAATGRRYSDAATHFDATGATEYESAHRRDHREIWLEVRALGTRQLVRVDRIAATRVARLSASARRTRPQPLVLAIRVNDDDKWQTVACGTSEAFEQEAGQRLLSAIDIEQRQATTLRIGRVRDEDEIDVLRVEWR